MKTSPSGKAGVLRHSVIYFFRFLQWRLTLAAIRPFNFLRETSVLLSARKWVCKNFFSRRYHEAALPVNIEAGHRRRFLNNYYLLKPLKILHLKNHWVYLTGYHGIVFRNFRILPESIHGKWDKRNVRLLKEYFPLTMDAWMYARHDKSGGISELTDERNYLLVHHWFNYYHWLTETMMRMWRVKESLNDYVVLLPEQFRGVQFVQQSLEAMNVSNVHYVKEGILRIKKLTLVQNKPYCNHYFRQEVRQIGKHFSDYVIRQEVAAPDFGDKIFISRRKAARRKLLNEEDAERMLSAFGFRAVALEDYTFFQQAAILSRVRYLIGMHGAGLTNMLFMPQGGKILELHREIYSRDDLHSDVYWKLAAALGHDYFYQFCEAERKDEDFFKADYRVDVEKLRANVELLLKERFSP
ncbi:MAG TPA: glycosyltransferase family 61 protein [Chitinophagales bacterium]|nr:glycosyltransferase family 61 protein [Chitinophagales bacterium]